MPPLRRLHPAAALALLVAAGACGAAPVPAGSSPAASSSPVVAPASAAAAPSPAPSACAPLALHTVDVASGRSGASIALVSLGTRRIALVADEENRVIRTIDAEALREVAVTRVEGKPAQLLPLRDGRVAVTLRDVNAIAVLELGATPESALTARCRVATYAEPFGLAISADGRWLGATAAWDHRFMRFDARTLALAGDSQLPAEPRGVIFAEGGRTAYVGHLVGGVVSAIDLASGQVTAIPVRPPRKDAEGAVVPKAIAPAKSAPVEEPNLAAGQGYGLVEVSIGKGPDGKAFPPRVLVPMASSDPMKFGAQTSFPSRYGGGGSSPAVIGAFVAVIDPVAKAPLGGEVRPLFRARPEDCILPRGVATSGSRLFVTCMGTNVVVSLDPRSVDPVTAEKARYAVGEGPTGIAIDEVRDRALVFSQHSLELSVIDLASKRPDDVVRALPLARPEVPVLDERAALGRTLFHVTRDVRLSADGRACASCHPDGRSDGLTWATPDGPRQSIFLAGRVAKDPPMGWFGDHASIKQHVRFTVRRLGGAGLEEDAEDERDLEALLAYLERLPTPSREGALVPPDHQATVDRGRSAFEAAGCAGCHPGGGSDRSKHDVGSGSVAEAGLEFDTPSLRFVSGSGPWFHDGRYATLADLLADPRSRMLDASKISAADRAAIVTYLESL